MNSRRPNRHIAALNQSTVDPIGDGPIMAVGIPAFGLSIPLLTGLHGSLRPDDGMFWFGFVYFIALSAAIWFGNRWLLMQQRRHLDWFAQPARKLMMLILANVLYTAPLTILWLVAWFRVTGRGVELGALQVVTLTNVICVIFVTHAYETVFLIRERESDMMRFERLERARVEGELAALTAQIDPHFLFNNLNTLGHVIAHAPVQARAFCDQLAEVYRYVLATRGQQLVSLGEELDFLRNYYSLLSLRFGPVINLRIDDPVSGASASSRGLRIPPLALQSLLENAVKHNQADPSQPLEMRVSIEEDTVQFVHRKRLRTSGRFGAGLGLKNLDDRCRLLAGRPLHVLDTDDFFEVRVPVIRA